MVGTGPDHVPTELVKYGAGILSRTIYPLFLKMTLRLEEAMQFKGGVLYEAWKGKHSPSECASHWALLSARFSMVPYVPMCRLFRLEDSLYPVSGLEGGPL